MEGRGGDEIEGRLAEAVAGDFARFGKAWGGGVRGLDGKAPGHVGDLVVRVAIERDGDRFASEPRVVDPLNGSILWSSRLTAPVGDLSRLRERTEEHTSELQSLMRISYAVFCLKKKKQKSNNHRP